MEIFYSLQAFMLHTKNITYILMAVALVCLAGWWLFLTERDTGIRKY